MKRTPRLLVFCLGAILVSSAVFAASRAGQDPRQKFDEFSDPKWEDTMARLDNYAVNLQNNPAAAGIIFVYGGQNRRRGEADAWSACIKNYLVSQRSLDATRLTMVLGGYRQKATVELWQAASKNDVPKASPSIKPADVKFSGSPIKKWRTLCNL